MSDIPDIIKTPIVAAVNDVFWEVPDAVSADMQPRDVLVLSSAFNDSGGQQLLKILQACQLKPDAYHVVQVAAGKNISWHQLRDILQPKFIILLGVTPVQLGILAGLHFFAPNRFNDRIWIIAPSLETMEEQQEVKKQLWVNGLKPVFVDKTFANAL